MTDPAQRAAERIAKLAWPVTSTRGSSVELHLASMEERFAEIIRAEFLEATVELREARADRDAWESTARRLASEAGLENSDYLQPDDQ